MLSFLKSIILSGADVFNKVVGGPAAFTRPAIPDPSQVFPNDEARLDAIMGSAEVELASFVRDGVFQTNLPTALEDSAIWQGVYAAMTAVRWRLNQSLPNQLAMREAAVALARHLHDGILCRGALPQELRQDFFVQDANAKYYFENGCIYCEDASLDSLLGVMFGCSVVARFGDEASKVSLALPLQLFSDAFAQHGFKITNRDGSCTTYGDCSPGFFQAPVRNLAAALPSLVSGGCAWQGIARKYGDEFRATDTQIPGKISYVNAHLAILANLTYACAAQQGAPGRNDAIEGLHVLMGKYADAGNSFLIHAAAALGTVPNPSQLAKADKVLLEFSVGPKPTQGLNGQAPPALQPVPVWQRPGADVFWQRNPYTCWNTDRQRYSRLDFLVAYYFRKLARS